MNETEIRSFLISKRVDRNFWAYLTRQGIFAPISDLDISTKNVLSWLELRKMTIKTLDNNYVNEGIKFCRKDSKSKRLYGKRSEDNE